MNVKKAVKIAIAVTASILVLSSVNVTADECEKKKNVPKCCGSCKKQMAEEKDQTVCPVMGGKINKDIYADYEGKRVYFCCKACIKKFREEPEKYLRKLEEKNVKIEDIREPQKKCPVMGDKINENIYADYQGRRVYFCCSSCVDEFKKSPEKYIEKMRKNHVRIKDVRKPQETCPVMGGKINKSLHADHEGKRVYFCCASCVNQFKEAPDKYLEKMREKGEKPEMITREEKKAEPRK